MESVIFECLSCRIGEIAIQTRRLQFLELARSQNTLCRTRWRLSNRSYPWFWCFSISLEVCRYHILSMTYNPCVPATKSIISLCFHITYIYLSLVFWSLNIFWLYYLKHILYSRVIRFWVTPYQIVECTHWTTINA